MVMEKFESQFEGKFPSIHHFAHRISFEDIDVQTQFMEGAMGQTTAMTTPQDQVDDLIQQVADEHGLEVKMEMPDAMSLLGEKEKDKKKEQEDSLSSRLAQLRNL